MSPYFTRRTFMAAAAAAAVSVAIAPAPASAQVDFTGETIEWIIPYGTGGGSDVWARFNAPFFSKYLPGNPTVVVRNVPGGGSITGTNQFAQRAQPDGLTILGTSGSTQFPYLLGDERVQYEYNDWEIVLASPTGGVVYTTPELGLESVEDIAMLRDHELVYASQGATSLDLVPLLALKIMNMNIRPVFGFEGRGPGRLAFERGETNVDYQTTSAYLSNVVPLVEEGKAVPLFAYGVLDEAGNIVRDPTFPDLPSFPEAYEILTGEQPSGSMYDAWVGFFTSGFAAQKMVFLPKDTPEEIVEAYRQAMRDMFEDPEYQAGMEDVLGAYGQVTDQAAEVLMDLAVNVPEEARQEVIQWLRDEYNVDI
jgi:tripartite-type tricarboxylate transporter receptor subunit TctC